MWTGAVLAWGTTLVAGLLETDRSVVDEPVPGQVEAPASRPAVPRAPVQGLLVIRYQPAPLAPPVTAAEEQVAVVEPTVEAPVRAPEPVSSGS